MLVFQYYSQLHNVSGKDIFFL
uniref:Uncharacterized protein n=1 Tax=Anguilla anguilla TaxID=7936 RepID=A0A0E9XS89_ANGAN